MARSPLHRTKTDIALEAIRERILSGELRPGYYLRTEAFAEELGMSATPVREALRLLQADRLVDYRPHQGIVVAGLSPSEMEEIYTLRTVLEPLAVERGAAGLTEARLRRLQSLHEELVGHAGSGMPGRVGELNASWHWCIYEACEMGYLLDFVGKLWERFPWRTMWTRPSDVERSIREHGQIMDAILRDDPREAGQLMRKHLLSGRESLLPSSPDDER